MYTGEDDTTRLECSRDSRLDLDVLFTLLVTLSLDPSLVDFITPPVAYTPMCSDQAARMRLPTLDDINITS
jgi:hypothetical protein